MVEADGVVRYTLPRRSLGLFGAIPLIVGTCVLGAGLYTWSFEPPAEGLWLAMFGVAFPLCGSVAVVVGLDWILGRAVFELSPEFLRASARVFGLGWWRSFPLKAEIHVEAGRIVVERGDPRSPIGDLSLIDGPARRRLTTNYELRLLRPFAAELNRRLAAYRSPMQ